MKNLLKLLDEEAIKKLGFEDAGDFFLHIANVDLTVLDNITAFELWQKNDGTKTGLLKLKKLYKLEDMLLSNSARQKETKKIIEEDRKKFCKER